MAAKQFKNYVFGAYPVRRPADQVHPPDLWHRKEEWLSRHGQRHLQPARADRKHAQCTGCRRVAIGAKQAVAGLAEVFLMTRMADAVSRPRIPKSKPLARATQEQVVVGVLVVCLDEVVVDILDTDLRLHAIKAHCFELEHD